MAWAFPTAPKNPARSTTSRAISRTPPLLVLMGVSASRHLRCSLCPTFHALCISARRLLNNWRSEYPVINASAISTTDLAAVSAWHILQGFYSALPQLAGKVQSKEFHLWTESYGNYHCVSPFSAGMALLMQDHRRSLWSYGMPSDAHVRVRFPPVLIYTSLPLSWLVRNVETSNIRLTNLNSSITTSTSRTKRF